MKKLSQSNQFLKDIKSMINRGRDIKKLQSVVKKLVHNKTLPAIYQDQPMIGNWKSCRDCHIEPDWVLMYYIDSKTLRLERTGSHKPI